MGEVDEAKKGLMQRVVSLIEYSAFKRTYEQAELITVALGTYFKKI